MIMIPNGFKNCNLTIWVKAVSALCTSLVPSENSKLELLLFLKIN